MAILDNRRLPITCECGKRIYKEIAWLKQHNSIVCTGCRADIPTDYDNLVGTLEPAEKALLDFARALRDQREG